ncbi:hypothetical protein SAMN05443574_10692 [Haloarcula vallismortis]|uniref:Uncharacterized protein n=2 Tax=Haloarcula vallismortis TaxID=28442 RepID=M0JI84_HALVA|nr:hypothetical protein [Haloarcula vallismortis]EMA07709.1 hypothetical protein C437_09713 [Haloarcula vallismortis ATCC 29715]SDW73302.1 hypothetical protein SAMN05443574_10692 [Haloarcula vallismortis]
MSSDTTNDDDTDEECTTTESFADHGLDDGSVLISRTYNRIAADGEPTFEPTAAFFDTLEAAFIWAYIGTIDEPGVPPHVEAAIEDARAFTRREFANDPDADLRTDVIPTFYQQVAGFHCAYRD